MAVFPVLMVENVVRIIVNQPERKKTHKLQICEKNISVPKSQNTVRLIFGKNELGAFSESLRPPSVHCMPYHANGWPLKALN